MTTVERQIVELEALRAAIERTTPRGPTTAGGRAGAAAASKARRLARIDARLEQLRGKVTT